MFERTSAKGNVYFTGRLGSAKIVVLRGEPTDDGCQTWNVILSEAPQKAANAEQRETRTVVRDPPSDGEQIEQRNAPRRNRYPSQHTEPNDHGPPPNDAIPF